MRVVKVIHDIHFVKTFMLQVLSRCSLSSGGNISVKQFLEVFSIQTKLNDRNPYLLQVLESAGVEPNDREVSKLERMSDESGEIERETFTAYAKKSEAFKEYMEAERKSGIDKAEIAFKVNFTIGDQSQFQATKQSKFSQTLQAFNGSYVGYQKYPWHR